MTDREAADAMASAKPGFDAIARIWRAFGASVTQEVIVKLNSWLSGDYKALHEEVNKLNKARNAYDNAFDKQRRNPGNAEYDQRVKETEAAHEAQIAAVKTSLAALDDYVSILQIV